MLDLWDMNNNQSHWIKETWDYIEINVQGFQQGGGNEYAVGYGTSLYQKYKKCTEKMEDPINEEKNGK